MDKEIYQERIDTSNVNLQTRELHCNYAVYIQNLRKEMYTVMRVFCVFLSWWYPSTKQLQNK